MNVVVKVPIVRLLRCFNNESAAFVSSCIDPVFQVGLFGGLNGAYYDGTCAYALTISH